MEQTEAVVDVLASLVTISTAEGVLKDEKPAAVSGPHSSATSSDRQPMSAVTRALLVPDTSQVMGRRLSVSVQKGELSAKRAQQAAQWVDKEIRKVIAVIQDLGKKNVQGQYEVKFGHLFEQTANMFEALSGTLKTAKKQKVVTFASEMLLQGAHDTVVITLLKESIPDSTIDTCKQCFKKNARVWT